MVDLNVYCTDSNSCSDTYIYCPMTNDTNSAGACNLHCHNYGACSNTKIFDFNGAKAVTLDTDTNNTYSENLRVFCGFIYDESCTFQFCVSLFLFYLFIFFVCFFGIFVLFFHCIY